MNNIEQLQKLLIDEIINKGYDQSQFEQYVQQVAPEKDDLSQWKYDDLQACITDFTTQQQLLNKSTIQQQSEISGFQIIDEKTYDDIVSNQFKIYIDNIALNPYEKTIKCQQEKYFIEKDVNLQFQISHPQEIRDSGLWSFIRQKYNVVFQIQTLPMQWKVYRTLQDFQDLRRIICLNFPEKIIPRFPFGGIVKLEEMVPYMEDIILSIKNLLQIYNKKPLIRTLQPCLWFVNEVNEQLFHKKMQEELKKEKKFNLAQKQTKTGDLKISLTFDAYKKYQDQNQYSRDAINLFNLSIQNLNEFVQQQKRSQEYLANTAQYLQELAKILPNYPEQNGIMEYLRLTQDHFKQIVYEIDDTCALLENHIRLTMAKLLGSHKSYIKLNQNVNEIKQKFVNDHNLLNKKKDDLIKSSDFKPYIQKVIVARQFDQTESERLYTDVEYCKSFLFTAESASLQQTQDQLVYMIGQFSKAMDEQFKFDKQKVNANFGGFLYAKQKLCQKYTEQWRDLIQKYENVKNISP